MSPCLYAINCALQFCHVKSPALRPLSSAEGVQLMDVHAAGKGWDATRLGSSRGQNVMRKEWLLQGGMLWTITSLCRWGSQVVEEHHLVPGWYKSCGPGKQWLCEGADLYRHAQQNRVSQQTCLQLLLFFFKLDTCPLLIAADWTVS